MPGLTADLTPIDHARAGRLVLAWLRGDKEALDYLVEQVANEPAGTPALLFAPTACAALLTQTLAPLNAEQQLEAGIARRLAEADAADDNDDDDDSHDDQGKP